MTTFVFRLSSHLPGKVLVKCNIASYLVEFHLNINYNLKWGLEKRILSIVSIYSVRITSFFSQVGLYF